VVESEREREKMTSREKLTRQDYEELIFDKPPSKSKPKKVLEKNVHLVNMITNNRNKEQQRALIETMNPKQMKGLATYLDQFLGGRIHIPKKTLNKLYKDKEFIYDLLKKIPLKKKKALLLQKGGSIQSLAKLGFQALNSN